MSWLSEVTGIHISAPPAIQHLGDSLLGLGVNAIPGGSTLDGLLNISNTQGSGSTGSTLQGIIAQTKANAAAQAQGAYIGANYVAQQQGAGYASLVNNPVALIGGVLLVVWLTRQRS